MRSSTEEQTALRNEMVDLIETAIAEKYDKVRTWVDTERVGPLGGISAKVFGAVEREGEIIPFCVNVYSDARIQEKLEDQLEREAEEQNLRTRLGW